jgi:hypothetical protein
LLAPFLIAKRKFENGKNRTETNLEIGTHENRRECPRPLGIRCMHNGKVKLSGLPRLGALFLASNRFLLEAQAILE